MRCRGRASGFRARVDIGSTLPRPAPRTRGSTPPGRTGPWRRWQRQAYRRRMRALLSLERVEGIEPSSKAWEAFVLPLNYTRVKEGILGYFRREGEPPWGFSRQDHRRRWREIRRLILGCNLLRLREIAPPHYFLAGARLCLRASSIR